MIYVFTIALSLMFSVPESDAQQNERQPAIWRQLIAGSSTVKSMFVTRSPQFILYSDGFIVFRGDQMDTPYKQVKLTEQERVYLVRSLESNYRVSGITNSRLKREEPYIQSMQKPVDTNNKNTVVLWLGMHSPPSVHRASQTLMKARSGNVELGPAWDLMYQLSQFLSTFSHPRSERLKPDEIEIAVQVLPSYLAEQASTAKPWPLREVSLKEIRGTRKRAFKSLKGRDAQLAYTFLSERSIVSEGNERFEVWVRPILFSE